MNYKYLSLFVIIMLSGCGAENDVTGELPSVGDGISPVIPDPIQKLTFDAPFKKQAFLLQNEILIDLSNIKEEGRVEINLNDEESLIILEQAPFTYLWKPTAVGDKKLHVQFFSKNGELKSEGRIEIVILSDVSEANQILTNVGQIVDVQIGESLTLTATSKGSLSQVEFLFNNELVKTFDAPPYTFDWTPTQFDKKEFTIRGTSSDEHTPVLLPKSRVMRSFSKEALDYCNEVAKPWVDGENYDVGAYAKHKSVYYTAKRFTMQEPTLEDSALNSWLSISCDNMTWLARPYISEASPGGRFNDGDKVKIGLNVRLPENPHVSIASVIAYKNAEEIAVLLNDVDQTYTHTFKGDKQTFPKDNFTVTVKNNFNHEHSVEIKLHGNIPPSIKLDIRQNEYSGNGEYLSSQPVILFSTVQDVENKVDYVEFYINGVSQGRRPGSGSSFEDVNISMEVNLTQGEYLIMAKAVDDDRGVTEITKSITVN